MSREGTMISLPTSPASRLLSELGSLSGSPTAEDFGPLSAVTGFLPPHPPPRCFGSAHSAWDGAVRDLPNLYWNLALRPAMDRMPVLPADRQHLPDGQLL